MQFLKRLKDIFLALLPIVVIVFFVHFCFYKIDTSVLIAFCISVVLICIGETLFLSGVDSTIMPMGDLMVGAVNKASKFAVFTMFTIVFGICATIAEPDVTVFSEQVIASGINIPKGLLIFFIGAGVGLFITIGIQRIIRNINIKYIYIVLFAIIFLLCTQVKQEHIAIAFDAGGATTGIVTAPFLLAISSGVTTKFSKDNDNNEVFGMLGLASLGPVIAVLIFFMMFGDRAGEMMETSESVNILVTTLRQSSLAIIPLSIVFYLYDLIFIKLPARRKLELLVGLLLSFGGLFLFLFGIEYGIGKMGTVIGEFLATVSTPVMMIICVCFGFVITFSEPSVIVLSKQVQTATKRNIPAIVVMFSIAISMALAILISALKIVYSINFFYIILIGYLIALILMFIVPEMFTSLAFDSGGVASGPMTSAFILPIMISLATQTSSAVNGFGLIGIVSVSPIIVLQILGLVYRFVLRRKDILEQRHSVSLSYTMDMYSNMEALEDEYNRKYKEKKWWRRIRKRNMSLFLKNYIQLKSMSFQFVALLWKVKELMTFCRSLWIMVEGLFQLFCVQVFQETLF